MDKEKNDNDLHCPEMQNVLLDIPVKYIKLSTFLFILIISSIFCLSYFIQYSKKVSLPINISIIGKDTARFMCKLKYGENKNYLSLYNIESNDTLIIRLATDFHKESFLKAKVSSVTVGTNDTILGQLTLINYEPSGFYSNYQINGYIDIIQHQRLLHKIFKPKGKFKM